MEPEIWSINSLLYKTTLLNSTIDLFFAFRERDDALMRAEQERQKVLALAAEDHATVRERILLLQETVCLTFY